MSQLPSTGTVDSEYLFVPSWFCPKHQLISVHLKYSSEVTWSWHSLSTHGTSSRVSYGHQGEDCLLTPIFTLSPLLSVMNQGFFATSEVNAESVYNIWAMQPIFHLLEEICARYSGEAQRGDRLWVSVDCHSPASPDTLKNILWNLQLEHQLSKNIWIYSSCKNEILSGEMGESHFFVSATLLILAFQ